MKLARHIICILSDYCLLWFSIDSAQADQKHSSLGSSGYLGLLIPVGPAHYVVILKKFKKKSVRINQFYYKIGNIYKIPIVICIQSFGGKYTRALAAQVMVDHFKIESLLYPGTSGAHIPPVQMHVRDIVIVNKQVNFANFYMSPGGDITPDEFSGKSSLQDYQYVYLNKKLEKHTACAPQYVSDGEVLPSWINGEFEIQKPEIYYYGIQGTFSMWLADKSFVRETGDVFHEADEDGDWYSATVAKLKNIPFIEASTISDSIFEFSVNSVPPQGTHRKTASQITQNISDKIILMVIKIYGHNLFIGSIIIRRATPIRIIFTKSQRIPVGWLMGVRHSNQRQLL